jgi:hypothetical protein
MNAIPLHVVDAPRERRIQEPTDGITCTSKCGTLAAQMLDWTAAAMMP